jgi:hypothetical protein
VLLRPSSPGVPRLPSVLHRSHVAGAFGLLSRVAGSKVHSRSKHYAPGTPEAILQRKQCHMKSPRGCRVCRARPEKKPSARPPRWGKRKTRPAVAAEARGLRPPLNLHVRLEIRRNIWSLVIVYSRIEHALKKGGTNHILSSFCDNDMRILAIVSLLLGLFPVATLACGMHGSCSPSCTCCKMHESKTTVHQPVASTNVQAKSGSPKLCDCTTCPCSEHQSVEASVVTIPYEKSAPTVTLTKVAYLVLDKPSLIPMALHGSFGSSTAPPPLHLRV